MNFFQKPFLPTNFDQHVQALHDAKHDFTQLPHTGYYESGQRKIDAAGVALVEYEKRIGIDKARLLLSKERELTERIAIFEQNLDDFKYSNEERNALIESLATGKLDGSKIHEFAENLKDWSSTVKLIEDILIKLRLMLAQVKTEKAKLAHISIQDAKKPDPLTRDERQVFEAFHTQESALVPVALIAQG